MNEPDFSATAQAEALPNGFFRAVLVMRVVAQDSEEETRLPLAGEQESAADAVLAAKLAVRSMANETGPRR